MLQLYLFKVEHPPPPHKKKKKEKHQKNQPLDSVLHLGQYRYNKVATTTYYLFCVVINIFPPKLSIEHNLYGARNILLIRVNRGTPLNSKRIGCGLKLGAVPLPPLPGSFCIILRFSMKVTDVVLWWFGGNLRALMRKIKAKRLTTAHVVYRVIQLDLFLSERLFCMLNQASLKDP